MPAPPPSLSYGPDLPFKYVGGDPSLDLVDTVDWTERGLEADRLTSYERLTRWAEGAGVVTARAAEQLRLGAEARPREATRALAAARRVRSVLQRVFADVAAGERSGAAFDDFDRELADALRPLHLAPADGPHAGHEPLRWAWRGTGERLESLLWPVIWGAAALLTSPEAKRIRVCAGPSCGWMYVDRSRNGLRRWCQMESCGTQAKSRRRSERARRAPHGRPSRASAVARNAPRKKARGRDADHRS